MEDLTLDDRIDAAHKALEQAEHDALQVVERISRIPGTTAFLKQKRNYGTPPNPWCGAGNLTMQAAIQQKDPALAKYLASLAGKKLAAPDYERQLAQQRQAEAAERLVAETERLRAHNQALRQRQEHERTYGRYDSFHGKYI